MHLTIIILLLAVMCLFFFATALYSSDSLPVADVIDLAGEDGFFPPDTFLPPPPPPLEPLPFFTVDLTILPASLLAHSPHSPSFS
jgi:hypothetical protein